MAARKHGKKQVKRWSQHVAETSNAMDLPGGIFTWPPHEIALGLKRSVEASNRTRGTKFQSAMSMLNFFENRAGRSLSPRRRRNLEKAKAELRKVFEKDGSLRGAAAQARRLKAPSRSRRGSFQ